VKQNDDELDKQAVSLPQLTQRSEPTTDKQVIALSVKRLTAHSVHCLTDSHDQNSGCLIRQSHMSHDSGIEEIILLTISCAHV
jgi:hypothetical protein